MLTHDASVLFFDTVSICMLKKPFFGTSHSTSLQMCGADFLAVSALLLDMLILCIPLRCYSTII